MRRHTEPMRHSNGGSKMSTKRRGRQGVVLVWVVLLITAASSAQAGEGFSGFFDWSDPTYVGEDVYVTVTLELVNRSGADVYDAAVTVEGLADPEGYGQIWVGDVTDESRVAASGDVVVPEWEHDGWFEGAQPRFRVDYTDGSGNAAREWIELLRMPLEEN